MKKIRVILVSLVLFLLITGCGSPVYQTITTDIPLINHKNDIRVDLGVSEPETKTFVFKRGGV